MRHYRFMRGYARLRAGVTFRGIGAEVRPSRACWRAGVSVLASSLHVVFRARLFRLAALERAGVSRFFSAMQSAARVGGGR